MDRLFAIWQAANPSHWFNDLPSSQRGLSGDGLLPFRKYPLATGKNRYWTSDQARDPEVFGYTYPDIADKSRTAEQLRTAFAAKYGWSRRLTPFQHFQPPPADMQPLDLSKAQVYQYTSGVPSASRFRPLTAALKKEDLPRTQQLLSLSAAVPNLQGVPKAQAPLVGNEKVSHEWYIDAIVER